MCGTYGGTVEDGLKNPSGDVKTDINGKKIIENFLIN